VRNRWYTRSGRLSRHTSSASCKTSLPIRPSIGKDRRSLGSPRPASGRRRSALNCFAYAYRDGSILWPIPAGSSRATYFKSLSQRHWLSAQSEASPQITLMGERGNAAWLGHLHRDSRVGSLRPNQALACLFLDCVILICHGSGPGRTQLRIDAFVKTILVLIAIDHVSHSVDQGRPTEEDGSNHYDNNHGGNHGGVLVCVSVASVKNWFEFSLLYCSAGLATMGESTNLL